MLFGLNVQFTNAMLPVKPRRNHYSKPLATRAVIHDLKTECGNLDHVVIGPTGVFALDTKTWRGVVSPDGNGELLLNGRGEKPHVKQLVGRVMGIRARVRALQPGMDAFIQAVFVFTSARVDADWGTTGSAHCIRDDQLYSYIVEDTKRKKLPDKEVKVIARAFKALAQMDPGFHQTASAAKLPPRLIPSRLKRSCGTATTAVG